MSIKKSLGKTEMWVKLYNTPLRNYVETPKGELCEMLEF